MAEDTEFTQIWADAFNIYQEKTGRDIKRDPTLRMLHTTDDLLTQIEQREQKFEEFRNKKGKLWSVLRTAMKPVELLGGLTQGALTLTPFSPASTVLGAVLFLVGSAKGVSAAYECITTLLSQLEDFTGRLQEYTKAEVDSKLRKKVTAILTTLLEIFARSEKLIRQGRIKQYLLVTFLGSNEKVAAAMGRLKALIDTEEKLVIALAYSTAQRTDKTVERTDKTVGRTEKTVERSEKTLDVMAASMSDSKKDAKEEAERKLVKDALDSPALTKVREIYGDVSDRRLEGTGQWIIDEPLFRAWIKKEAPIVWILGGPGAGKSFLSSKIISHLQEIYPQDPQYPSRVSIGYFYIKEDNQQLRSLNTILKSIAFQIASNDPVYRKYAVNVCNNPDQISSARGTWKRLFTDFFGSAQYRDNSTVIVIDGLDEAPKTERESLLRLLRDLEDSPDPASRARIQIALVGRPELRDDIFSAWDQRIIFIEVSAMKNTADIASYIKSRIPRVKILKNVHLSPATRAELRKEIDDKLTEGANGMFLWVNLMLDQIYNKSRPSDIRAALKDAPRDLAKMIRHVFERLANDPNVEKDDLNEMLAWVTCAQRPLLLGELDVILKLRPPVGEGMPDLEDRLRGQFASFFTLTREDNLTTEGLQHRARQAIHSKQESHIQDGDDKDQDSQAANQSEDDFDAEEGFQSDFKTTIIQFSHASIKDYLVQEGKPDMRKWPADLGIGIEMNRAEQHIVKTCLSILCDKNHGTDFEAPNLSDYAADHFMEHLVLLDKSAASETNRRAIRRSLFLLFNSESPLETWINKASDVCETFLTIWLGDSKYRECVRGWFAEEDASDDQFSDEEILWMQKAGKSDKELFRPLAMLCATRWLKEINVDPAFYVWVLHIYLAMDDDGHQAGNGSQVNLDRLYLKEIPLSRLRLLAEFAGFEKTPRWHARLGKVLREAKYVDAAIKEFLIAIRMDEQYWGAKDGLALCYGELKEFALAIEWEQKALALVPKEDEDMKGSCWQDICRWRLEINDVDGAIKASKEAYSLDPEDPSAMNWHITTLEAGSRLEEMLEFVEGLERKNSPTTGESLLTELLSTATDVHDKIAHAARALGRLDFVLNGIETAIAGAERKEDAESLATLRYHLATFKFRHTDNKEEAMDMWEYVLESTAERKNAWDFWFSRTYSSDQLSQLYFGEAIAAEKAGARPDYWISKLERLSKQDKGLNSERDVYSTKNASLILGLWYRLHGQVDEAHACFRAKVLEGIDILTDDDPNNDMWGYSTLAETLLIAGDKENAAAAFAITNAPLDKLKASRRAEQTRKEQARGGSNGWNNAEEEGLQIAARLESESNSSPKGPSTDPVVNNEGTEAITEKAAATPEDSLADRSKVDDAPVEIEANEGNPSDDISSYFMWSCDGQCKRKVEDWTALYFCEHCLSTCFCDQCIELVKTKKLPFRKCDPEHPFYQVYPVGEKMEEIAAVKVDGKIMPHTEWLEKLRKTWAE